MRRSRSGGRGRGKADESALVGEDAAEAGVVGHGLGGEGGDGGAGEEGELEVAAVGVGDDPVGLFAAAESVVVEEMFGVGDAEAVEVAGSGGRGSGVEEGARLGGLERADLGEGVGGEVDDEFVGREDDVAGDGFGVGALGAPVALVLGADGGRADEGAGQSCAEEFL